MNYVLKSLGIFIFCFCSTFAYAQTAEDCANNSNDSERLKCYDAIYKKGEEASKESAEEPKGKWHAFESESKLDDTKTVGLILLSDNEIDNRFSGKGNGIISLVCIENRTVIMIGAADHYLADIQGYGDVIYRVDKEKAKTVSMDISTDNERLGFWSGAKSIPFIKNMIGKESLIIRITPFKKSPETLEFNIKGLEEAIKPLREVCKW